MHNRAVSHVPAPHHNRSFNSNLPVQGEQRLQCEQFGSLWCRSNLPAMNIAKFINVIEDESSTRHSSHFAQQEYARAGSPASLTMCRINARVRGTESEGCNIQCQTSIAYSSYTTIVIHSNTLVWVKSHISLT